MGLVDGTITEDSDAFLFGSRRVYKGVFSRKPTVVEYSANLLEAKVGLDRERLIMLALFLGCDYCEGVKGVGLVNGMEIISSYEDFESLIRWKEWAMRPDLWLDIGKKDNVYQKAMGEFFLLCSHFCL